MEFRAHAAWLTALLAASLVRSDDKPHSRQKRILWITNDGRLALPPGTALVITPSLSLPFVRYPPDGFLSNMTISLPFTSTYSWPIDQSEHLIYLQQEEPLCGGQRNIFTASTGLTTRQLSEYKNTKPKYNVCASSRLSGRHIQTKHILITSSYQF